ncbi:MAG: type pilus assembly PilZ [Myxococcales bacterium]|nr:type pilus assembly PilZ [Myxococcales bacterium]
MADNRRTSARYVVSVQATLAITGANEACTIMNLSLGGALITASKRHAMGERVNLTFKVPTAADAIEIGATVRWADTTSVGVQFDGLRARDVWALNEYFKSLAA